MAKNNKIKFFGLILIFLSVITLTIGGIWLSVSSQEQEFALIGEQIWLPQYLSGRCVPRADNLATININSHSDDGQFYSCTTQEANKYIPLVNGIECKYEISDFSSATVYLCDGIVTNKADLSTSKCQRVLNIFSGITSWQPFIVNAGDSIYINTNKVFGDAKLRVEYPSYGLLIEDAQGQDYATTNTCEVNSINGRQFHTIDVGSRLEIKPDFPFNVVTGLQRAISTHAVTLNDVANGQEIYIVRPGYYNLIKEAEDGFKYVDTNKEYADDDIECIPRTTGCSDEAKIIELEDQSCDIYGGAITNYAPVQGDNTQLCKYTCSGGTLSKTSDCIKVQTDCPADKPLWDTETGECAGVGEVEQGEPLDYTPFFLIAFGVIVILIVLTLLRRKN